MGQAQPCFKGVQKGVGGPHAAAPLVEEKCGIGAVAASPPIPEDSSSHGDQPAPIAELGPDGLPSVGSALHFSNECKRCAFFSKGRCQKGHGCQFCHFDHDAGKRAKKKRGKDGSDAMMGERCAPPCLSTEAPHAGVAVPTSPANVCGNPVTLEELLRRPPTPTAPLDVQQLFWSQQQWGGPVQQWPYAGETQNCHYDEHMYPYGTIPGTGDHAELFSQDAGARNQILAMVGAWDALKLPMVVSVDEAPGLTPIIAEDPGVDSPPLSRYDLLRFRKVLSDMTTLSPVKQDQHGIRAVKDLGERSSPEKASTGFRKRKGRAAASAA